MLIILLFGLNIVVAGCGGAECADEVCETDCIETGFIEGACVDGACLCDGDVDGDGDGDADGDADVDGDGDAGVDGDGDADVDGDGDADVDGDGDADGDGDSDADGDRDSDVDGDVDVDADSGDSGFDADSSDSGFDADSSDSGFIAPLMRTTPLHTSGYQTCAVSGGLVRCWGLPYGHEIRTIPDVDGAVFLSVEVEEACAVDEGGSVNCWKGDVASPPIGLTDVLGIGAGPSQSCAVLANGTVECWGFNGYGELGPGRPISTVHRAPPETVMDLPYSVGVTAGGMKSCALIRDGTVRCWGTVWDGTEWVSLTGIVAVDGLSDVTSIDCGWGSCCVVRSDGSVSCWGNNESGQLGDGTVGGFSTVPVEVVDRTNAVAVAVGVYHACAVLADGSAKCWGMNGGRLGDGTMESSSSPVVVSGLSDLIAIATGFDHTCAMRSDQAVFCWGWAYWGVLGYDAYSSPDCNREGSEGSAICPIPLMTQPPIG